MAVTSGPNLGLMIDGNPGEEHYEAMMKLLRGLDGLVQCRVVSAALTAPPGGESNGDIYIPAATATGAWAGLEGKLVRKFTVGTGAPGWEPITPKPGWKAENLATGETLRHNGSIWEIYETGSSFDQDLNTTDDVDFNSVSIGGAEVISSNRNIGAAGGNFTGQLICESGVFETRVSGNASIRLRDLGAAADSGRCLFRLQSGAFNLAHFSDDLGTQRDVLLSTRSGVAVTGIKIGNSTDDPDVTIYGDLVMGTSGKGIDFAAAGGGVLDYFDDAEIYDVTLSCSTSGTITLESDGNSLLVKTKGDEVTVSGFIDVASVSAPLGNLTMPLPYTAATLSEGQAYSTAAVMILGPVNTPMQGTIPMVYLDPGATSISIVDMGPTGPSFDLATHIGANTRLIFNFTYKRA